MARVMSYTDVRQARAHLETMRRLWPDKLVEVPREEWPPSIAQLTKIPAAVMRSKDFLVQIYEEGNDVLRLSINRCRINDDGSWSDQVTWDELQQLKRECGLGALDAVEVFPCEHDVVNVANMRHLWVLPRPLQFVWRNKRIEVVQPALAPQDIRG